MHQQLMEFDVYGGGEKGKIHTQVARCCVLYGKAGVEMILVSFTAGRVGPL